MSLDFEILEMLAATGPEELEVATWIAAFATAAIIVILGLMSLPRISIKLWGIRNAAHHTDTISTQCNSTKSKDSDSGYAGSESESELEDIEMEGAVPNCHGDLDEQELGENYDLHRAIRLCEESATPKRTPHRTFEEDFEAYASFLSATEKKVTARRRTTRHKVESEPFD